MEYESPAPISHCADEVAADEPLQAAAFWEDDTNQCGCCNKRVGKRFLVARHHCRACGKCVCSECSPHRAPVLGMEELQRVCNDCQPVMGKTDSDSSMGSTRSDEVQPSNDECPVCLGDNPALALLPCKHLMCGTCVTTMCSFRKGSRCPLCRVNFHNMDDIIVVLPRDARKTLSLRKAACITRLQLRSGKPLGF
jgi:hypothetical protein